MRCTEWPFQSSRHGDHNRLAQAFFDVRTDIYQMTQEATPLKCVALDHNQWRINMRMRLHQWRESVPNYSMHSKLAPESFWDGALSNALLRVYSPSKYMPDLTEHDFDELRWIAMDTIELYRQNFRDGELRFYWRTLHFLYLAGEALVHCAKHLHAHMRLDHDSYGSIKESADSCATVL